MRINILSDTNWESKVGHAMRVLNRHDWHDRFAVSYGAGVDGMVIGLMCRDPSLGHKQRVRFEKATRTLYVDVMLDLPFFVRATHGERRSKIYDEIVAQLSAVLQKRKIRDFDATQFIHELSETLREQLTGPESSRFDHLVLERATGY